MFKDMTEFKGTKVEWDLQNEYMIWGRVGELLVEVHPTYTKKENAFFNKPTDEYKFNAKLIACAPEMLEALKEMIAFVEFHGYMQSTEINNARQLISKATTL